MALKVGVGDRIIYGNDLLATVERLTKTQAVCRNDVRFLLDSGKKVGTDGWNTVWGAKATDEDLQRITQNRKIKRATQALRQAKVTPENLELVEAFIASLGQTQESQEQFPS